MYLETLQRGGGISGGGVLTHASRSSSDTGICIQGGALGGIVILRQARVRQTLQPSINMLTKIREGFDFSRLGAESCLTLSLGLFGVKGGLSGVTHTFFSGTTPPSSFGPSAGLSRVFSPFYPAYLPTA